MQRGALALFDALGFKGIWQKVTRPERVVEKLRAMQRAIDGMLQANFGGPGHPKLNDSANTIRAIRTTFLSDTVAIAVVPKTPDELHEGMRACTSEDDLAGGAVAYAATLSGYVYRYGLTVEPAWAYRGAIAYGDFYLDDRFMVGAAVDEAASNMNSADGAFVWLAPSAKSAFESSKTSFGGPCTPLARYVVPLKGGAGVDTFVASPFRWQPTVADGAAVAMAIDRTFGSTTDPAVAKKHLNTRAFLEQNLRELGTLHGDYERLLAQNSRRT
ncbi:MAG TPA: hypothetical protein VGG39_02160 [Polyangiaceae bacterium]|jgi:hypothetical protein